MYSRIKSRPFPGGVAIVSVFHCFTVSVFQLFQVFQCFRCFISRLIILHLLQSLNERHFEPNPHSSSTATQPSPGSLGLRESSRRFPSKPEKPNGATY